MFWGVNEQEDEVNECDVRSVWINVSSMVHEGVCNMKFIICYIHPEERVVYTIAIWLRCLWKLSWLGCENKPEKTRNYMSHKTLHLKENI